MSNPATPASLALALNERLGGEVADTFDDLLAVTLADGQRSEAHFDAARAQVLLRAPVARANDGVPDAVLRKALQHNAPGGPLMGGTLRVRPGRDYLEIADDLPLALGPQVIAGIMLSQARAAAELSDWFARESAASA